MQDSLLTDSRTSLHYAFTFLPPYHPLNESQFLPRILSSRSLVPALTIPLSFSTSVSHPLIIVPTRYIEPEAPDEISYRLLSSISIDAEQSFLGVFDTEGQRFVNQLPIGAVVFDMVHQEGSIYSWHVDKSMRKIDLERFCVSRVTNLNRSGTVHERNGIYEGVAMDDLALCCCLRTNIFMMDAREVNPIELKYESAVKGASDMGGIAWTFQDHVFVTGHQDGFVRLFDMRKISTNLGSNLADYVQCERHLTPHSPHVNIEILAFNMDDQRRDLYVNTRLDGIFCMDITSMDRDYPLLHMQGNSNTRLGHRKPQILRTLSALSSDSDVHPEYVIAPTDTGVMAWDTSTGVRVFNVSPKIAGDHSISHAQITPDCSKLLVASALSIDIHHINVEVQTRKVPATDDDMDTSDENTSTTAAALPQINIQFELLSQSLDEDPDWMQDDRPRDARCTYDEGYTTQQVFSCLQCSDVGNPAGMCRNCAEICHAGHNVVALGNKSHFRCDCGSASKFPNHVCQIYPQKQTLNEENKYNHNFQNRWCYCDGLETQVMLQCFSCEDWFHSSCLGMTDTEANDEKLEDVTLLCRECESQLLPDQDLDTLLRFVPLSQTIDDLRDTETVGYKVENGKLILLSRASAVKRQIRTNRNIEGNVLSAQSRMAEEEEEDNRGALDHSQNMSQRSHQPDASLEEEDLGETEDEEDGEEEEENEEDDGFFV